MKNRKLYSYPIFSLTEINEYPKLFENYFNDHLSFRNELVKLKNYIDIRIFNNFMSSDLLFAKDKWVLSKNVFLMNRNFSIEELKQGAYNLLHF
ncbi:hypothetical protein OFR27_04225 [Brachyspira hyodysenteriae]|nr:hypothetical protein [Brachyspira hyodysenteriae]MDA0034337.1 hypothetical protein [Brachyspira hyodysenteriae]